MEIKQHEIEGFKQIINGWYDKNDWRIVDQGDHFDLFLMGQFKASFETPEQAAEASRSMLKILN